MARENTNQSQQQNTPDYLAWHVTLGAEKSFWNKVGAAWQHKDGRGYMLQLENCPITYQIVWEGVQVEITYRKRRWKSDFDHIELHVEEGCIIPVTETGYRSHFLPAGIVDSFDGYEGFVRAWLDHEAENSDWKKRKETARQMSLF